VLGLLGPNGAGKTTAVRIFTTLLEPDSGHAEVRALIAVRDANRLRSQIGLAGSTRGRRVADRPREPRDGRAAVPPHARRRPGARARAARAVRPLGRRNRPARTYSGGMRRRLDLAASLIVTPPVLFLDEPTTGLDPRSRLSMWDLIEKLRDGGTTLL